MIGFDDDPYSITRTATASIDYLRQETLLTLMRAADEYQNRLVRMLRPHDLTPSQYNVLRILRGAQEPLPCLEIANRLIQVVPAITGLIRRLENAGLVERTRCQRDRRVIFCDITPAGVKKLDDLDDPMCDLHEQLLGHLDRDELETALKLIGRARESVASQEEASPQTPDPVPPLPCGDDEACGESAASGNRVSGLTGGGSCHRNDD